MKLNTKFPLSILALFFLLSATRILADDNQVGIGPSFKGPIGIQLHSFRSIFKKNIPGGMEEVQSLGLKYVELAGTYKASTADFKAQLDAHGLVPISAHYKYEQFRDHLNDLVKDAETLGLKYAGCPFITHTNNFDEKTCREAIAVFNHAGEVLAQHGIQFFYHPHGYEFEPYGNGTLLDLMMAETNPKHVSYQMDIFWIVYPGQDPVKLLHKYKGRWALMHLKDMSKALTTRSLNPETAKDTNDVALGAGQMDMPAILKAAQEVGIKWYFIEDESPSSKTQVPVTLKYLETVKW